VMAPRDDPWISCLYQLDTVVSRMFQRGNAAAIGVKGRTAAGRRKHRSEDPPLHRRTASEGRPYKNQQTWRRKAASTKESRDVSRKIDSSLRRLRSE